MNKIRNNMFYLMTPDEIYKKYGRFKGLGNAYTEFAQFGGSSELVPDKEIMRYTFHRQPVDKEAEKQKLQSEIENFQKMREKTFISSMVADGNEDKEGEPDSENKENPQENEKEGGDKLEFINKMEEEKAKQDENNEKLLESEIQKSPVKPGREKSRENLD